MARKNSRKFVKQLTDEDREEMKRMVASNPGYVRVVEALAKAFERHRALHPESKPIWLETKGVMLLGAPLDDEHSRGYVAGNADAHAAIAWVDEATGKEGTLFQVQCALSGLGWTR